MMGPWNAHIFYPPPGGGNNNEFHHGDKTVADKVHESLSLEEEALRQLAVGAVQKARQIEGPAKKLFSKS